MLSTYKPSGRKSARGWFFIPLLFVVVSAGAVAYEGIQAAAPMWVFGFCVLLYIAGIGIAVDRALTYSHWRSPGAGAMVGLAAVILFPVTGYIAIYKIDAAGASSGKGFLEFLSARVATGIPVFKGGGATSGLAVNGWILIILWILEAGAFLLVGMGAAAAATERVYCESCRSWANRSLWEFKMRDVAETSLDSLKDAAKFEVLLSPAPLSGGSGPTLEYAVHGCRCGKVASLKITSIFKKKDEEERAVLREDIALSLQTLGQLLAWAESHDPSLEAKRPKLELADRPRANRAHRPLSEDKAVMELLRPSGEHVSLRRGSKWLGASDSYVDNEFTRAVRARVKSGDFLAAEDAIRMQRHPDDLAFVVEAMADWDVVPEWFDGWIEERPDSFVPRMVRGIFYLKWGWHARGMKWKAKNVGRFLERLEMADNELQRAAAMEEKDPISRAWLVYTAMGLGLPKPVALERFEAAIARWPANRPAYSFIVTCFAEKWGGSDEKMLEIARRGSASAPAGKSVHTVIAEAHLEAVQPSPSRSR